MVLHLYVSRPLTYVVAYSDVFHMFYSASTSQVNKWAAKEFKKEAHALKVMVCVWSVSECIKYAITYNLDTINYIYCYCIDQYRFLKMFLMKL